MAMKYVAAYLMNVLAGKEAPSAKDVEQTLQAVGADVDSEILKTLLSGMEGKSAHEVREEQRERRSSPSSACAPHCRLSFEPHAFVIWCHFCLYIFLYDSGQYMRIPDVHFPCSAAALHF